MNSTSFPQEADGLITSKLPMTAGPIQNLPNKYVSPSQPYTVETSTAISTLFSSATINTSQLTLEECDEVYANFTRINLLDYSNPNLVRILLTWLIFIISATGNSFVLASVTIRRPKKVQSHSQIMMTHLTLANLAFTVFILPTDAVWQTTKQWYGGDFLCRLANILKQFAMYSSSAMIVVMSIDRVVNLRSPMSKARQRKRILWMLGVAWAFSLINAIPAGALFSVTKHIVDGDCPDHSVVQCVDQGILMKANLGPYYVYTMIISFFGPLICIFMSYILIALEISKMAKITKEAQKRSLKQNSGGKRGLDKARRISLVVTALIAATFIVCWGPYYVMGLIEWFQGQMQRARVPQGARDFMLMSVYLNPMLHPLITIWLIKEVRESIAMQFRRNQRTLSQKSSKKKSSKIVKKNPENGNEGLLNKNGSNGTTKTKQVWL